jgi:hypothetical protein
MRLTPLSIGSKRLRLRRKPMTIAAGFRCSNGIVLCSDTEYSHGQSHKTYGTKIAHFVKHGLGFSFAMAGAGGPAFMERVFDDFADGLEERIPGTLPETIAGLEGVLRKLYKQHIFPIPKWQDAEADAQFVIAVRTPDGKQDLFQSAYTVVAKAGEHECVGMGADVGETVIDMAACSTLTVAEAAILSIHVLERVKAIAQFCGGASAVVIQEPSGVTRQENFKDICEIEESLRELQMEIAPLMLSWTDESLAENDFQQRLTAVTLKVNGLRNRFLRERDTWKLTTKELMDFLRGGQA